MATTAALVGIGSQQRGRIAGLLAAATDREQVRPSDARSGAVFERFRVGERWYFLKRVRPEHDWVMRVTGDRDFRTAKAWNAGLMRRAEAAVVHAVLDVAAVDGELFGLMDDVGDRLVPPGDTLIAPAAHHALLDGLAGLAATFAGWVDVVGLVPMVDRFRFFATDHIADELARPDVDPVVNAAAQGWALLEQRAAEVAAIVRAVHARPDALAAALARTPSTFLHGDPKLGNLGVTADGRAILLDWAYPGAGPATWELGWYLALNAARLPEPKEDAIDRYAAGLRGRGVGSAPWFDQQLTLALLGVTATLAWEKALGGDDELGWWCERALSGAALLDRAQPGWRRRGR